jgi:hypothetical protein
MSNRKDQFSSHASINQNKKRSRQSKQIQNQLIIKLACSTLAVPLQACFFIMDESTSCPICLCSPDEVKDIIFCKSPCLHEFCVPCVEHFLLKPRDSETAQDFYNNRPTTGNCPLCRQVISLFDLKNSKDNSCVYKKNRQVATWPIKNQIYRQQNYIARQRLDLQSLITKRGTLNGCGISFNFLGADSAPRMEFLQPLKLVSTGNQKTEMDALDFQEYHFFEKTMTFHGVCHFDHPVMQFREYKHSQLDCLLQFSRDGQFVRDGFLRWKLAPNADPNNAFPLDGTWEVSWKFGLTIKIHVQDHCFYCMDHWYEIELDENHCPKFTWPGEFGLNRDPVRQTSTLPLPPGSTGPQVGETLEWKTTFRAYEIITWKRLSMDLSDAWKLIRMKPQRLVYRQIMQGNENDNSLSRPSYHVDTLWGNTFCQAFCVGLASYHFVGPDADGNLQAYISYEHPRTASWPPLDNGTAVPPRVQFRNTSWDASTRTFRGDICWLEVYETRWQGEAKWSYEIQFDPSFMYISGGTCSRQEGLPHRFGEDLVYVNAAAEDPLRNAGASFETAPEATKAMLQHVVDHLSNGAASTLFDFNLQETSSQ